MAPATARVTMALATARVTMALAMARGVTAEVTVARERDIPGENGGSGADGGSGTHTVAHPPGKLRVPLGAPVSSPTEGTMTVSGVEGSNTR